MPAAQKMVKITSLMYSSCLHEYYCLKTVSVYPGGQINLICQASPDETLLQWSLTIPGHSVPEPRFISSDANTANVSLLIVGQTVFQILRPLPHHCHWYQ